MEKESCPTNDQLSDYIVGNLAIAEHDGVERHVDDCAACQTTVEALDSKADTLFPGLRANKAAAAVEDPALRRLVDQAKAISDGRDGTSAPADARLSPGTSLGNYVLAELIGSGGMGRVFKATHRRMKRDVAVKVLSPALLSSPVAHQRFQREVEAAAKLSHPNIVAAYDADEADGRHFLVMQYVAGRDLNEVVKEDGALSIEQAVQFTLQASRGLEYAHELGIVHRDIKPANLLLDEEGTVKILDMGLARLPLGVDGDKSSDLTTSRAMMGTAAFMAPEQAANPRAADLRADIYSLGCTLFYLLTGRQVFEGPTAMEVVFAHREQPVPSLREILPACPSELDGLVQSMLAKRPEDRPQSMRAVIEQLDSLVTVEPSSQRAANTASKRTTLIWGAAALAALAIVVIIIVKPWSAAPSDQRADKPDDPPVKNPALPPPPEIKMVSIKPGKFLMGAAEDDLSAPADQKPRHEVRISNPFQLGACEITRGQFAAVMGEASSEVKDGDLPVAGISWLGAIEFCNRLSELHELPPYYEISGEAVRLNGGNGFRLPTEAEWEYACRADTQTRWHFGDDPAELGKYEWHDGNSDGQPKPVGKLQPNPWGLHDMHGNVPEWCWDRYDPNYYKRSETVDPPGSSKGDKRVFRGGAASNRVTETSAASRAPLGTSYGQPIGHFDKLLSADPIAGSHKIGFRVARSVKPTQE